MKKSTLLKVACLALLSIFVFSLVACGGNKDNNGGNTNTTPEEEVETFDVYLDPNGGTLPEGTDDIITVESGKAIGSLPIPTRGGYEFLGWFEEGNERWEVDRRTKVEYEMEIVALWEALGDLVMVEFTVGTDEELSGDIAYIEVLQGQRLNTVLKALPTATRPDHKFKGWKDKDSGATITITTKIEGDMVLVPVWEKIIFCLDGTENHAWQAWQEATEATCTTPAQSSRLCGVCGYTEYNVTQEALGHKFGQWATTVTENGLVRSRVCTECDEKEADPLTNITFDSFKTPVIDGDCWGGDKGQNLINGVYTDKDMCGKGTGALVVTLEAKEATYVDIFAVTGQGSASYTVTVYYGDGTFKDIGVGSFGSGDTATKAFNIEKIVTKIVVTMESPSNGTDYWSELSVLVVPKA